MFIEKGAKISTNLWISFILSRPLSRCYTLDFLFVLTTWPSLLSCCEKSWSGYTLNEIPVKNYCYDQFAQKQEWVLEKFKRNARWQCNLLRCPCKKPALHCDIICQKPKHVTESSIKSMFSDRVSSGEAATRATFGFSVRSDNFLICSVATSSEKSHVKPRLHERIYLNAALQFVHLVFSGLCRECRQDTFQISFSSLIRKFDWK